MATKKKKKKLTKKTKKPAKKSKKVVKKTAKKKVTKKKPAKKKIVKKTKKKATKKTTKKKVAKKPAKKSKKVVKKIAKKVVKKIAKKLTKKITKKTTAPATETRKERKNSFLQKLERELELIQERASQVTIKGSEGFEYCRKDNCDQPVTTEWYCRYHYLVLWDLIKERKKILSEGQLKKKIKDLSDQHSAVLLDYMLRDFSNEQDFFVALSEMKLPSYSELTSEN